MNHCGTKKLNTERLVLRRFTIEDAKDMYRNLCSDSRVNRFLTWELHKSLTDTEELMRTFVERYENPARYCWAIVDRATSEVIGTIAAPTVKERTETVEVTYAISYNRWGQGIAAEALKAVINFLFTEVGVNRIEAGHDINNPNSGKVMEKAGMSKEGILRKAGRNNQGIFDLVMYSILKEDYEKDDSLKIYLEDGKIKVKGTVNLGYIGSFKDSQIELEDSLEDIREWDIIEEYYNPNCSDDELISYLNVYYKTLIKKIEENIDNINGTFLLQVFTDMDNSELDFMTIDGLFDEGKLLYGNEEDIAEVYNPVRQGLNSLSPYLETPNDGSIPKGHLESVLRSFYPMFNFDYFLKNIVPEYIGLGDGEISFQCSDNFDCAILCGAYAVLDEELAFSDWHNY